MTQPRRILPGTTYLITRRTLRRHFLFRPDPDIRRLFLYALCVNAKRFHIHFSCTIQTPCSHAMGAGHLAP